MSYRNKVRHCTLFLEVLVKHLHPTKFFKIDRQTALWEALWNTERFGEQPKLFITIEIAFKRLELYVTKLA